MKTELKIQKIEKKKMKKTPTDLRDFEKSLINTLTTLHKFYISVQL